MKEVVSIQYLRGAAALLVVLHHIFTIGPLRYLATPGLGGFGVDIFFVISGFIMWHTTADSKIGPVEFWRRRIIRIVPLYWLFLGLLVAIAAAAPSLLKSTVITPESIAKSFLFVPHYNANPEHGIAPILVPGWSLNYEMFFYVLFGLALFVQSRQSRVLLLGVALLGLALVGLVLQPTDAVAQTYTNQAILKFFDGVVLALVWRSTMFSGAIVGLLLIAAGSVLHFVFDQGAIGMLDDFIGLSPALVAAGALALEPRLRQAPSALLRIIGDASYAIYLSHLFFVRLTEFAWQRAGLFGSSGATDAIYVLVTVAVATAGGIAIHYLVERPLLARLSHRRRPAARMTIAKSDEDGLWQSSAKRSDLR